MSKRLGAHAPARHSLQSIVAHRGSRSEALRNIGLIHDVALFRRVAPHTGDAIGLQLDTDGKLIARAGFLLLQAADLSFYPEQILNVVPNFVGDHICFRKLTWSAEPLREFLEKTQ